MNLMDIVRMEAHNGPAGIEWPEVARVGDRLVWVVGELNGTVMCGQKPICFFRKSVRPNGPSFNIHKFTFQQKPWKTASIHM